MVSLTNRTTHYDVLNQTESLILSGYITLSNDWRINAFYGKITNLEDLYVGNFSYMEHPDGKSSKSLDDADTEQIIEISRLINDTLAGLKQQIEELKQESEVNPEEESE